MSCRVLAAAMIVFGARRAEAQGLEDERPPGYEDRPRMEPPAEVLPEPISDGFGLRPGEEAPWRAGHDAIVAGAVTLTLSYLGAVALGTLSVVRSGDNPCDAALGGVQAVPVFGPIGAWAVLGLCQPRSLDSLVLGIVEILPALGQLAGFVAILIGAAGRRGGVARDARVDVGPLSLRLSIDF